MGKWIDLQDKTSGAKLKIAEMEGSQYLFIVGLSNASPNWLRAQQKLGFNSGGAGRFLVRKVQQGERISPAQYHPVWPFARIAEMDPSQYLLDLSSSKKRSQRDADGSIDDEIARATTSAIRLGRNAQGLEVYQGELSRFVVKPGVGIIHENAGTSPSSMLRAPDEDSLDQCADGFVRSLSAAEVQHSEDFDRFMMAVMPSVLMDDLAQRSKLHSIIDAAVVRHLVAEFDTAADAYGLSVQLYELQPAYRGLARGAGTMPIALSVMVQRMLGDTAGQRVVIPYAFDGASFSFLPRGTRVQAYRSGKDLSRPAQALTQRLESEGSEVQWGDVFVPTRDIGAQALFFNADPKPGVGGQRQDLVEALTAIRSLQDGGRAVLVLACDAADAPGEPGEQSRRFLQALGTRYDVNAAFEVGSHLTRGVGTSKRLRVVALRNAPPMAAQGGAIPPAPGVDDQALAAINLEKLPVAQSWDEVKAQVDEAIARSKIREAQSASINVDRTAKVNRLQAPYLAFSKIGEARTMVPRNLQAAIQGALADLESAHGPVDDFIMRELGWGPEALAQRLGPEQVDGTSLIVSRLKRGRGVILSDETGIGKGRTIATVAAWASMQGRPVIFVTDRANLFTDLVRDMRDVGEFGRFRPLVTNADGHVVEKQMPALPAPTLAADAQAQENPEERVAAAHSPEVHVLVKATPAQEMAQILSENRSLVDVGENIVFTTYSQFAGEDNPKAVWLKNQLPNALLILDEAHVAAGSDSSIARHVSEMSAISWGALYSSATWAKTPKNLHIYARALPESVNIASVISTIKRQGDAFSEVMSAMLARDGALIRREHDLSRLEFVLEVDPATTERNREVADKVAEIMGKITMVSGDLERMMMQISRASLDALKAARQVVREAGGNQIGSIFSSAFFSGSMLYRVQRRMNAALNVSNAVRLALRALEEGRKPTIVFDDTAESYVKRAMGQSMAIDLRGRPVGADVINMPSLRDLMLKVVEDLTTVKVDEVTYDDVMRAEAQGRDLLGEIVDQDRAAQQAQVEEQAATGQEAEEVAGATEGAAQAQAGQPAQPAQPVEPEGIDIGQTLAQAAATGDAAAAVMNRRRKQRKRIPFHSLPGLSAAQRQAYEQGIDTIRQSIEKLPMMPISIADALHGELRSHGLRTGEISGRGFTLEKADEEGRKVLVRRRLKTKALVNATVGAFNSGELDVVLINRSGATGLSLHASPRFMDKRRRELIELQPPENPTDRVQLFGRVNRFDQLSFPRISIAATGVPGETRHVMMQNRKLAAMSANVRSSRETHAIVGDVVDLLNSTGRAVCKQFLLDNPLYATHMALPLELIESDGFDAASAFTRNISLLPVAQQEVLYDQVNQLYEDERIRRELAGETQGKIKEFDWRASTENQEVVMGLDHGGLGSAFDGPVFAKELKFTVQLNPPKWSELKRQMAERRRELIASGHLEQIGTMLDEHKTPIVSFATTATKVNTMVSGLARLSVRATKFATVEEAQASDSDNAVKRATRRAEWLKQNLQGIYPGVRIDLRDEHAADTGNRLMRPALVVDVLPPKQGKEGLLGEWNLMVLRPGAERAQPFSLAYLAREAEWKLGEGVAARVMNLDVEVGSDLFLYPRSRGNIPLVSAFKHAPRGERIRRAAVLAGNMFLATEFVAQAKVGSPIIYTNDQGVRERAILLDKRFSANSLRYMPVRIWVKSAVERLVLELSGAAPHQVTSDGEGKVALGQPVLNAAEHGKDGAFHLYMDFGGAWGDVVGTCSEKGSRLSIRPGYGIVVTMEPDHVKRFTQSLSGAQRKIREQLWEKMKREQIARAADAVPGTPAAPVADAEPDEGEGDDGAADTTTVTRTFTANGGVRRKRQSTGLTAAQDADHVVVSTEAKRMRRRRVADLGEDSVSFASGLVVLKATTPGQLKRAVQILWEGAGLQLYVPPFGELGRLAKRLVKEDLIVRARIDLAGDPQRLAKFEEQLERLDAEEAERHMARQLRFMRLTEDGHAWTTPQQAELILEGDPPSDDHVNAEVDPDTQADQADEDIGEARRAPRMNAG